MAILVDRFAGQRYSARCSFDPISRIDDTDVAQIPSRRLTLLWFLLGQLLVYAIGWAIVSLVDPQIGSTFLPWLFAFGILGESLAIPFLDTELSKPLADGLRDGRVSRWLPFGGGVIGAVFWIIATIFTWWLVVKLRSALTIALAVGLTFLWVACGVGGALAFIAELARPRDGRSYPDDVA